MPNPAYAKLKINGADLVGEVVNEADEHKGGAIEVVEFHHELNRPIEVSMQIAGRRIHAPIRLIKKIDKTSPQLYQALVTNQEIDLALTWYRADPKGVMIPFFQHTCAQGAIVSIKQYMPYVKDPAKERFTELEEIGISYGKITWKYIPDNMEYTDEGWQAH